MNENRKATLKALREKKASKLVVSDGKPFIEALESKVNELVDTLGDGLDINNVDLLLKGLEEVTSLREDLTILNESIKNLNIPAVPDKIKIVGMNDLLQELKKHKEEKIKIDMSPLNNITDQVGNLINAIEEIQVPKQGQEPGDYIPMRRVMMVGKKLLYDDSFYTGGGGGGSTTPTINGSVPVVNPDGTPISTGGGSGGDVNLNEVGGDSFTLGQKDNTASLPVVSSADTTRIDEVDSTHTYIGTAVPGSSTSNPLWQIKLIDSSSGTSILFADGDNSYNNVWDNRALLSYS